MTGFESKRQAAKAKLIDDADTLLITYQQGFADGKRAAQRKPLTDKDIKNAINAADTMWADADVPNGWAIHFARAIEAAHNIKEQPPEQEPVAYYHPHKGFYWAKPTHISSPTVVDVPPVPLYVKWKAAQRQWVGLEIEEVQDSYNADYQAQTRAVEKLLKGRNT
jgi:hypothetical protein